MTLIGDPSMSSQPACLRRCHCLVWLVVLSSLICSPASAQFEFAVNANRQDAVKMWILGGQTEDSYQKKIRTSCDQSIVELKKVLKDKSLSLRPEQETRLDLAREGTTSQFMSDILQYEALTGPMNVNDQNDQQKALQILQPAMMEAQQGWYGKAYFEKLLNSILDAEQKQALADYRRERTERMHRVMTMRMVADLTDPLALTKSQRDQLLEQMNKQAVKEMPPNYNSIICFIKILRIPDEKLNEFLDAKQAEALRTMVAPYQNFEAQFR